MNLIVRKTLASIRLPGWLPFRPRPDFAAMRSHERHSCCVLATLLIVERGVELEGLLLEASFGGLLFREASAFVFDRHGAAIKVRAAGLELSGRIVNVRSRGYGIRLDREMTQEQLQTLLSASDVRPVDQATH